jgi:hypothetical protein
MERGNRDYEHGGDTRAKARLGWRDQTSVGIGTARLNPDDRNVAVTDEPVKSLN